MLIPPYIYMYIHIDIYTYIHLYIYTYECHEVSKTKTCGKDLLFTRDASHWLFFFQLASILRSTRCGARHRSLPSNLLEESWNWDSMNSGWFLLGFIYIYKLKKVGIYILLLLIIIITYYHYFIYLYIHLCTQCLVCRCVAINSLWPGSMRFSTHLYCELSLLGKGIP